MKARELTYMERKLYAPKWHETVKDVAIAICLLVVVTLGSCCESIMDMFMGVL